MLIKNRFGRIVDVSEELGLSMIKKKEATAVDETPVVVEPEKTVSPLECVYCGKMCASEKGVKIHLASCKKKVL